jgi:hypothetical protein
MMKNMSEIFKGKVPGVGKMEKGDVEEDVVGKTTKNADVKAKIYGDVFTGKKPSDVFNTEKRSYISELLIGVKEKIKDAEKGTENVKKFDVKGYVGIGTGHTKAFDRPVNFTKRTTFKPNEMVRRFLGPMSDKSGKNYKGQMSTNNISKVKEIIGNSQSGKMNEMLGTHQSKKMEELLGNPAHKHSDIHSLIGNNNSVNVINRIVGHKYFDTRSKNLDQPVTEVANILPKAAESVAQPGMATEFRYTYETPKVAKISPLEITTSKPSVLQKIGRVIGSGAKVGLQAFGKEAAALALPPKRANAGLGGEITIQSGKGTITTTPEALRTQAFMTYLAKTKNPSPEGLKNIARFFGGRGGYEEEPSVLVRGAREFAEGLGAATAALPNVETAAMRMMPVDTTEGIMRSVSTVGRTPLSPGRVTMLTGSRSNPYNFSKFYDTKFTGKSLPLYLGQYTSNPYLKSYEPQWPQPAQPAMPFGVPISRPVSQPAVESYAQPSYPQPSYSPGTSANKVWSPSTRKWVSYTRGNYNTARRTASMPTPMMAETNY